MSVYGIDLGTTYSCLCKFEDGKASVIQNVNDQSNSLPSAVYFESENSIVVGAEAKAMVQTDAANVVQFIKREIGKPFPPHEFFGQSFNAVEISALILKKIKTYAEEQGENVKDVVITCPAYFGLEERAATKQAGELAGLNVLGIINEPTAASISYAFRQGNGEFPEETVAIYDLGGGTFDVTVLKISSRDLNGAKVPHFSVIATGGDDTLGGKDWDDELEKILIAKVLQEKGCSEDELDEDDLAAIKAKIEITKKSLSSKQTATVRIPVQGETVKFEVTREEFEEATAALMTRTTDCLSAILAKPEVAAETISKILLVGGSSNMPMVPNKVKEMYPDIQVQLEEPELAVAKGAACYASLLTTGYSDEEDIGAGAGEGAPAGEDAPAPTPGAGFTDFVDDLTPRSFGIGVNSRAQGWTVNNLVKKDVVIGEATHIVKTYYVPFDGCEQINVPVYQNISQEDFVKPCTDVNGEPLESDPADQVSELGKFVLNIPEVSRRKGHPMVVDFTVDSAGIHIRVTDGETGEKFPDCDIVYNNTDFDRDEAETKIQAFSIAD